MSEGITRRRFVKVGAVAAGTLAVGGTAVAIATRAPEIDLPSSKMGEGGMKALVVYATKSGCTTRVAEKIGEALAARGFSADVVAAEKAGSASEYDAVVVGSGVRTGTWHEAARTWVASNADALKTMPVAFYTCGLTITDSAKTDEVRGYTDKIIEETGVNPVDVGLFAGWNEPKKFSFLERTIMKVMKAPEGDFRDFAAIAEWTDSVAASLGAA